MREELELEHRLGASGARRRRTRAKHGDAAERAGRRSRGCASRNAAARSARTRSRRARARRARRRRRRRAVPSTASLGGTAAQDEHERHDHERDVEREDPPPRELIDDPAPGERADDRRDPAPGGPRADRGAALLRGEGGDDDRERRRRHERRGAPWSARAAISTPIVGARAHGDREAHRTRRRPMAKTRRSP